ncbi:hypothetical protein Aab01nite_53690 [Paractinoplanes abujensis]|uniref:Anti-anti-sigma factor n=1 Tax=Paractinoplanes abujensis TaxID=882441 RepID=A0A7W7CV60_9ACTN|nr:STAS domain-containing protein [Actinoplanes abujensis]MBB4693561.1 anti-anti-sigma factor [Actinoplanes abujensis]GID21779.1 hypothetical protein Aab01nite_53690 [Actinoplanes abujensis]
MTAPMSVVKEAPKAGSIRLRITGEIDMSTSDVVEAVIATALRHGAPPRMIIDLSAVWFIDAAGVQALLDGQRYARAHGVQLFIDQPTGIVLRTLTITGTLSALSDAHPATNRPLTDEGRGQRSWTIAPQQPVTAVPAMQGVSCA